MKPLFLVLLSFIFLLSADLFAQTNKQLVQQTKTVPTIDGQIDELWMNIPEIVIGNKIDVKTDFNATYKVCWDASNFYLLLQVNDNTPFNTNPEIWKNDNVEVYFDMDNSKKVKAPGTAWNASTFDQYSYMVRFQRAKEDVVIITKDYATVGNVIGAVMKQTEVAGGYIIEASFPWTQMYNNPVSVGSMLGFDLVMSDSNAGYRNIKGWHTVSTDICADESMMGTIQLFDFDEPLSLISGSTSTEPVIDAGIDELWNSVAPVSLDKIIATSPSGVTGTADFSCTYRTTWDAENFYILLEVKDDVLYQDNKDSYMNDNVEIYFDLDNSKNMLMPRNAAWPNYSFDMNDSQIRLNWGTKYPTELRQGTSGNGKQAQITYAQKDVSGGYVMEAKIPWSSIGFLTMPSNSNIGFDLLFSDNDGDGRNQITWSTGSTEIWHDASVMGNMQLSGVVNPKPMIAVDGQIDDKWSIATSEPLSKVVSGAGITVASDFDATYKLLWDANNVYLMLNVIDDKVVSTATNIWDTDNAEIYFDTNNSKKPGIFDATDFQIRVVASDPKVYSTAAGIVYGYAKTDKGYTMEVQVPWASLGLAAPDAGKLLGFDILLSDNDGGSRDAKAWNTTSFNISKDESLMGEIQLTPNGSAKKGPNMNRVGVLYYVSPTGDDSNEGISESKPFKSIQKAADLTLPGDTVFIMNGTFQFAGSELNIKRSGNAGAWITYKALKGNKPKIKITGKVWKTIEIAADYITIEGIEIEGDVQNPSLTLEKAQACEDEAQAIIAAGGTPDYNKYAEYNTVGIVIGGNTTDGNHHIIIRRCKVHDLPAPGIGSARAECITVEDNIVYNTNKYTMWPSSGISLYHLSNLVPDGGYKNFVRRNICYNNKALVKWITIGALSDGNGIIIDDSRNEQPGAISSSYTGRTLVENNVCFDNGGSGIHAYLSDHVDIINNTAYNNGLVVGYAEIFQSDASDGVVMNNIMYAKNNGKVNSNYSTKNVVYDYNIYFNGSADVKGTHDKFADPMFMNASVDVSVANFQLKEGSLAIDYGTSVFTAPAAAPAIDVLGIVRPRGNGIDAGAYESAFTALPNECFVVAPTSGESFKAGTTITISAFAKVSSGSISKVEFYQGSAKLGESSVYPYSFIWNNVPAGNYTITARAYDSKNVPTVSEGIPVRVSSLESVQKIVNGEFDDKDNGWSLIAMNGAAGNLTVDAGSALSGTNSALINITTKGANNWETQFRQSVSLIKGRKYTLTFTAKAAENKAIGISIQKNGSPYTTFFQKTVNLTTAAQNFGPFTYTSTVTDPDCSLEFLLALNLGKVWIDNVVLTEIDETTKPVCSITAPAMSAGFDNPAEVTIAASAAAAGTTVSKVDFYANGELLGTDKTKPYTFSWTGFKNGDYLLTAVSTDANGNIASSAVTDISISNITGIGKMEINPIQIYPNPATDYFRVQCLVDETIQNVAVYNLQGRLLIEKPVSGQNSPEINISLLSAGLYLVEVKTVNKIHSFKLVK